MGSQLNQIASLIFEKLINKFTNLIPYVLLCHQKVNTPLKCYIFY